MRPAVAFLRLAPLMLAGAIGLAAPDGALAQQRADTSGRALDANPQVGSGGVNNPQGQIDFRIRNDIVTGNVSGGRGFQDDVGYRAPGEFGDTLGSEQLFRFRTQSFESAPSQLDAPASSRSYIIGGGTSIYREFTSLPAARPLMGQTLPSTRISVGGYGTLGTTTDPGVLAESRLLGDATGQAPSSQLEMFLQQPQGRALEVIASPLLGVRATEPVQRPLLDRSVLPPGLFPQQQLQPRLPSQEELEEAEAERTGAVPEEPPLPGQPDLAPYQQPVRISPSLLIGQQLSWQIGSERADRSDAATQQRLDRLERLQQQLFRPLEEAQDDSEAQQDPYLGLLQAVREGQAAGPQVAQPSQVMEQPGALPLPEPSEQEVEQAEQARDAAMRRALGLSPREPTTPGQPAAGQDSQAAPGAAPGVGPQPPAGQDQVNTALEDLMSRLDYDLPPMQTLAGASDTRFNELMRQAESELAASNYLAAEQFYRRAILEQPDRPLAQVGLIHAQLGAGMVRSAAFNLRRLFEEHPELIAARYEAHLLPSASRMQWIQGELQRMMSGTMDSPADPALMLAYVGYQAGSRPLVRYGLATAQARSPRDPLLPLLRRIWLEESPGDQGASSEDAAQPAQQPSSPPEADGK